LLDRKKWFLARAPFPRWGKRANQSVGVSPQEKKTITNQRKGKKNRLASPPREGGGKKGGGNSRLTPSAGEEILRPTAWCRNSKRPTRRHQRGKKRKRGHDRKKKTQQKAERITEKRASMKKGSPRTSEKFGPKQSQEGPALSAFYRGPSQQTHQGVIAFRPGEKTAINRTSSIPRKKGPAPLRFGKKRKGREIKDAGEEKRKRGLSSEGKALPSKSKKRVRLRIGKRSTGRTHPPPSKKKTTTGKQPFTLEKKGMKPTKETEEKRAPTPRGPKKNRLQRKNHERLKGGKKRENSSAKDEATKSPTNEKKKKIATGQPEKKWELAKKPDERRPPSRKKDSSHPLGEKRGTSLCWPREKNNSSPGEKREKLSAIIKIKTCDPRHQKKSALTAQEGKKESRP